MEESKDAGGGDFYDRVYAAERPELFFKATGRRVVGHGKPVRIRSDAKWSVPEPELTLFVNTQGVIAGYTIGNDMSSRDIEGENPLYLPQAKVYDGSCAIGPCILLSAAPSPETRIQLEISRDGKVAFSGSTSLVELKRELTELAKFLFRDNSFPDGVFLMTGTGIVPGDDFTLRSGDAIRIRIDGIGSWKTLSDELDVSWLVRLASTHRSPIAGCQESLIAVTPSEALHRGNPDNRPAARIETWLVCQPRLSDRLKWREMGLREPSRGRPQRLWESH